MIQRCSNRNLMWSSVPDLKRKIVPAKGIVGLRHDEELCTALVDRGFNPTTLEVTVSAPEVVTRTASFSLDLGFLAELRAACERLRQVVWNCRRKENPLSLV